MSKATNSEDKQRVVVASNVRITIIPLIEQMQKSSGVTVANVPIKSALKKTSHKNKKT